MVIDPLFADLFHRIFIKAERNIFKKAALIPFQPSYSFPLLLQDDLPCSFLGMQGIEGDKDPLQAFLRFQEFLRYRDLVRLFIDRFRIDA